MPPTTLNIMRNLLLISLLLLCSCYGNPSTNSCYNIALWEKSADTVKLKKYVDVVTYAFYNDTTKFIFSSYKEAREGQMTNVLTKEKVNYDIKGVTIEPDSVSNISNITASKITVVICDTVNKVYAYRQSPIAAGLDSIFVILEIEPYRVKEGKVIEKRGWIIKR